MKVTFTRDIRYHSIAGRLHEAKLGESAELPDADARRVIENGWAVESAGAEKPKVKKEGAA